MMMDCCEVQKLLSAYYDGELQDESRTAAAEHLAQCAACAGELAAFEKLSTLTQRLGTPEPPADLWGGIERQLDRDAVTPPRADHARRFGAYAVITAVAAAVLVAVSIGVYETWFPRDAAADHHEMAADFRQYLDRFGQDPDDAQSFLLAKYQGESAEIDEAARKLGYRPVVATGMPSGFSRGDVYVMDMPSCKCVQCTCKRDDGKVLAIFEHDEKEPGWFGDRPVTEARCGGKECRIVQFNDRLAVSWQQGNRHLTVIGANTMDEVAELVEWFSKGS